MNKKKLGVVIAVITLTCFILLCLLVFVIPYHVRSNKENRALITLNSSTKLTHPIILPIYYDKNAIYVADVFVDQQRVTAVVDTGSAHLLVAGSGCDTCLLAKQNGVISPRSSPKEQNDQLRYGSQKDVVDWYDGEVRIQNYTFLSEYALVRKRVGSSSYNIMGVGRLQTKGYSRHPNWLSYLSPGIVVTFEVENGSGRLWLGGPPGSHPTPQFEMPMLPPPFYRVALHSIRCGTVAPVEASMLPAEGVVFDTGSNMMDVPPRLYNVLKEGLEAGAPLELVFGSSGFLCNGSLVRVTYTADQYRWNKSKLLVLPGSDTNQIVLGSMFMNALRLTFDTQRNVFGLSKLSV